MNKNKLTNDFTKFNDFEKEEYITDIVNALHAYISSDKESRILDNFSTHIDEIRRAYDYIMCNYEMQNKFEECREISERYIRGIEELSETEKKLPEILENMQMELEKYILDMTYYSRLYALCEVYKKEENKRRNRKEFYKVACINPKLTEVALEINNRRRMKYIEIKQEFDMSDEEMSRLLRDGRYYFNLTKEKNRELRSVSLNPKGKQYIKCIVTDEIKVSQTKVDDVVTRNCETVISSLRASIIKGRPHDIKVIGVTPASERKIKCFYRENLLELVRMKGESYGYRVICDVHETEGGKMYEIPRNRKFV